MRCACSISKGRLPCHGRVADGRCRKGGQAVGEAAAAVPRSHARSRGRPGDVTLGGNEGWGSWAFARHAGCRLKQRRRLRALLSQRCRMPAPAPAGTRSRALRQTPSLFRLLQKFPPLIALGTCVGKTPRMFDLVRPPHIFSDRKSANTAELRCRPKRRMPSINATNPPSTSLECRLREAPGRRLELQSARGGPCWDDTPIPL